MRVLACQNKHDEVRMGSSSGGIFPLIAARILDEGGVVYGAAFSDSFAIEHRRITTKAELKELQGSKYAFGRLGSAYRDCQADLESGLQVLFSGTPCQIAGLRAFLKKDYPGLFVVDFICHGAPELSTWEQYLKERANGRKVSGVWFRDKRNGWNEYRVTIQYADGTEYSESHDKDLYMMGFVGDVMLRNACFHCKCKGVANRQSDLTLGDLWGADELAPELYDDKGTSLLIVSTEKGEKMLASLADDLMTEDIDKERAFEINWAAVRPAEPSAYVELFQKYKKEGKELIPLLKRIYEPNAVQKVQNICYRGARKMKKVMKGRTKAR